MLQTNLIFGIQKKIKEGSRKESKGMGMIEENSIIKEETATHEPILESSFIAGIYEKTSASKKKAVFQQALMTESFQMHKAQKKLEKDVSYFNFLYENFVDEVFQEQYKSLLESIFDDTIKLYRECDVTPRLISMTLDSNELNENQIVDIYKNRLNETIKNDYTKPMLSGEIAELYENEITKLTRKLIQEGSTIDMEQVKIYMPFEETLYKFNRSILMPETAESRIYAFMESTTEEYLMFVEESAEHMLQMLEKKIKLLTSMISPNMFDASVEAEGVEAPKMAGISITVDDNFNDDECMGEICPSEVAATDPEAAAEMADEEEALEIDEEGEDLEGAEDATRDEMGLATDGVEYEDEGLQDPQADLSPTEASIEQAEPTEIENSLDEPTLDSDGVSTNDSDLDIAAGGNDHGTDGAEGATVPGAATSDSEGEIEGEPAGEDVSQEGVDEEMSKDMEDVSEEDVEESKEQEKAEEKAEDQAEDSEDEEKESGDKDEDEDEIEESTTQDKKPKSQGGAGNSAGSMDNSATGQNKKLSKSKGGALNSKGSMDSSKTSQDTNI